MIGRRTTVTAALKNPKPGAVRLGLEAAAQPKAYYWVSGGDDGATLRLNLTGLAGIEWIGDPLPQAHGMAMCLVKGAARCWRRRGRPPGTDADDEDVVKQDLVGRCLHRLEFFGRGGRAATPKGDRQLEKVSSRRRTGGFHPKRSTGTTAAKYGVFRRRPELAVSHGHP